MTINLESVTLNPLFFYGAQLISLLLLIYLKNARENAKESWEHHQAVGLFLLSFLILVVGTRPLSAQFTDMHAYDSIFNQSKLYPGFTWRDPGFTLFVSILSPLINSSQFFLLVSILYFGFAYLALNKLYPNVTSLAFISLASQFYTYSYAVNGIRSGVATSLFIYGIAQSKSRNRMITLFTTAILFHFSIILPILIYLVSRWLFNIKTWLVIWAGIAFVQFVSSLNYAPLASEIVARIDTRYFYFRDTEISGGFGDDASRLAIFFFSLAGVSLILIGQRYVSTAKILFKRLSITFLSTNSFWLLTSHSLFSERVAYLSWILIPLLMMTLYVEAPPKIKLLLRLGIVSNILLSIFYHNQQFQFIPFLFE